MNKLIEKNPINKIKQVNYKGVMIFWSVNSFALLCVLNIIFKTETHLSLFMADFDE